MRTWGSQPRRFAACACAREQRRGSARKSQARLRPRCISLSGALKRTHRCSNTAPLVATNVAVFNCATQAQGRASGAARASRRMQRRWSAQRRCLPERQPRAAERARTIALRSASGGTAGSAMSYERADQPRMTSSQVLPSATARRRCAQLLVTRHSSETPEGGVRSREADEAVRARRTKDDARISSCAARLRVCFNQTSCRTWPFPSASARRWPHPPS